MRAEVNTLARDMLRESQNSGSREGKKNWNRSTLKNVRKKLICMAEPHVMHATYGLEKRGGMASGKSLAGALRTSERSPPCREISASSSSALLRE
jgi:hypothetical protein